MTVFIFFTGLCKKEIIPVLVIAGWMARLQLLNDGINLSLSPEFEYESHGVEDARIVKIDDLYYLTYTAYDGTNARGALAISNDLKEF